MTGALPEVVGDGGLLVDATDPWALAGAVDRVMAQQGLRESLAQSAARRIADLDLPSAGERAVDLVDRPASLRSPGLGASLRMRRRPPR